MVHSSVKVRLVWLWQVRGAKHAHVPCHFEARLIGAALRGSKRRHAGLFLKVQNYIKVFVRAWPNLRYSSAERIVIDAALVEPVILAEAALQ